MEYFIGIDGGGTKTKLVVVDRALNIIYEEEFAASNLISTDSEMMLKLIEDKINQVTAKYRITGIGMGMAGIDTEEDRDKLIDDVRYKFSELNVEVANDGVASLLGALNRQAGVLINSGTGSIAIGLDERGKIIRAGGWDYLLGDEGSGYWIGKKFIQAAVNHFDSGWKDSDVVRTVEDFFEISSLEKLISLIYSEDFQKERIAELAIEVSKLAYMGNQVAQDIYTLVGKELACLVKKVFGKGVFSKPVRVTYSGSIFKSYDLFRDSFILYLKQNDISFEWKEPFYPPEIGAALLVMNEHSSLKN